ncbi:hypothetical protein JXB02_03950 [Candidatus Woesearchaeota archaeon]|nr:hypothetical protein [Candidatus Woesearchaeota archaeon]
MIRMPYEKIIGKIKESAKLSDQEIDERIKLKLSQLAGLISKEGAAHIVANELGIKLFDANGGKFKIQDILMGMRSVETVGRVTQVFPTSEFTRRDGTPSKVGSFVIGDETGTIRVACWGDKADVLKGLRPGDIVKVKDTYVRDNRGRLELHANDRAVIQVNPAGESAPEIPVRQAQARTRKKIADLQENDQDVELLGTIVQVFDPRYFEVCPDCNRRVRDAGDGFSCEQHGKVTPDLSFVFNLFIDDGSETIRVVCFRNQAVNLTGRTQGEIIAMRDQPEAIEAIKTDLLGNTIKVVGRAVKNEMFGRLEFIANIVDPKPDPKDEVSRLKDEIAKEEAGQKPSAQPQPFSADAAFPPP